MRARRAIAATVTLLVLVACGADGADDPDAVEATTTSTTEAAVAPEPVDGMQATIEVSRLFALQRAFSLGLENVGDRPRQVVQVGLETPLYETAPFADRPLLLLPGTREFTMPVPYGDPSCDGDPAATFTAVVVLDDGTELRIPAPEKGAGAIGRVHERDCRAQAVLERVDLRFGDEWEQDGLSVTGELVLEEREPGPPVVVEDVTGSVVFRIATGDAAPVLAVGDGTARDTVEVVVTASRCDPHGISEAKRLYVFVAWLAVDGEEAASVDLHPEGATREAFEALLAACLEAGGSGEFGF